MFPPLKLSSTTFLPPFGCDEAHKLLLVPCARQKLSPLLYPAWSGLMLLYSLLLLSFCILYCTHIFIYIYIYIYIYILVLIKYNIDSGTANAFAKDWPWLTAHLQLLQTFYDRLGASGPLPNHIDKHVDRGGRLSTAGISFCNSFAKDDFDVFLKELSVS